MSGRQALKVKQFIGIESPQRQPAHHPFMHCLKAFLSKPFTPSNESSNTVEVKL